MGLEKTSKSKLWLNPTRDLLSCSVERRRKALHKWDLSLGNSGVQGFVLKKTQVSKALLCWVTLEFQTRTLGPLGDTHSTGFLGATQKANPRNVPGLAVTAHSAFSSCLGYEYNVKKYGE